MVNVKLILRPRLDFDSLKPDDTLFTIWIEVYEVSERGKTNTSFGDNWVAALHYTKDELMANKFSIQGPREMVKMLSEKRLTPSLEGCRSVSTVEKSKESQNDYVRLKNIKQNKIYNRVFAGSSHTNQRARNALR